MRLALLVVSLAAFAGTASAQTECQSIRSNSARLACYDKASPPAAKTESTTSKELKTTGAGRSQDTPNTNPGEDLLARENARLDAALKNICRGC